MTISIPSLDASRGIPAELTLAVLREQNETFRGSGGVSEGNRSLGFRPAFYDMDTGIVHASRFSNGMEAPMHVLDGLPDELVVSRLESGRVESIKPGIVAGFMYQGHFFTRKQAALATERMDSSAYRLSNPQDHRRLLKIWERFVEERVVSDAAIRPVVEASWQRCQTCRVDPDLHRAPLVAEAEVLEDRRHRQVELRDAARPVLQRAGELLFDADSLACLADAEGLILDVAVNCRIRPAFHRVNLLEGGLWNEQAVGTNAIGTALAAGEPVQLYGAEHFCSGIKQYTCSADVIRDPHDGRVLGVVDLSGRTRSYRPQALEFAMSAARTIEANLLARYLRCREQVIEGSREAFRRWQTEGMLAFDRRGRLVKANTLAHGRLRRLDADMALTPQTRLPALDLEGGGQLVEMPAWLQAQEQEQQPIRHHGQRVGTLVTLSGDA